MTACPLRGGAPALVGQISDAGWSPDGSLILGRFWREEMHYVGLATVSADGEFTPVVLWHPEELKDIFPNSPTWIGTWQARALRPWPRPRGRRG